MTVLLQYAAFTTLGSTYNGGGVTTIHTYTVGENQAHTTILTSYNLPAALKSGAAKSLVIGPGPAYDLSYYGYFVGAGGGVNAPLLAITGHTGAAQVQAGAGSDGEVRITYVTNTTVVASVQPVAVTDDTGNQMPAGFMGATSAAQPASNPTVPETWHSFTFQNSWTQRAAPNMKFQYCLVPWGPSGQATWIKGVIIPGTKTDGTVVATLPAGYYNTLEQVQIPVGTGPSTVAVVNAPWVQVNTDGTITVSGLNLTGLTNVFINGFVPLGSP
jgi:hypothetical protein